MNDLPILLLLLGGALTLTVAYLAAIFWAAPERGMDFATHRPEGLPQVMVNRYFVIFMVMGASLWYGRPEVIAFVFAVTGLGPLHDAWIYFRLGESFQKHLIPAALSAIVSIWSLNIYLNNGAA